MGLLIGMQCLAFFAGVYFRVGYGAPQVRSLRKNRANLYRRTPHYKQPFCPPETKTVVLGDLLNLPGINICIELLKRGA